MLLTISVLICFLWQVFNSIYPHFEFVVIAAVLFIYGWHNRLVIPDVMPIGIILFIHAAIAFMNHTLSLAGFVTQFFSVALSYLFFYNIVRKYKEEEVLRRYCKVAFGFAVFGILQAVFAVMGNYSLLQLFFLVKGMKIVFIYGPLVRIEGLCTEPYNFAVLLLPAVYCAMRAYMFQDDRIYNRLEAAVVMLAFLLTFSGAGMVGLGMAVALLLLDHKQGKVRKSTGINNFLNGILITVALAIAFVWAYFNIPMIAERVNDSVAVLFDNFDIEKATPSVYTIASNFIVAKNELMATMGLGVGFGSYGANFDKFSEGLDTSFYIYGLNRLDGSNLFIRFMGELGILGIILIAWFIIKFRWHVEAKDKWMSNAVLLQLFLRILRFGNYTMFGLGLFVSLYATIGSKQHANKPIVEKMPACLYEKRIRREVIVMVVGDYIKSDLKILTGGRTSLKDFLEWYFFPRGEMFRFTVWYRILLLCRKKYGKIGSIVPYYILRHYEFKYGIHVNPKTHVGRGLHIVHGDGVHLNCESIGDNFTIYQGVTLGADRRGGIPVIGNNVTIYTNAVVVGKIKIGDHATIGANTFVNKDVESGEVIVGCPGRPVHRN